MKHLFYSVLSSVLLLVSRAFASDSAPAPLADLLAGAVSEQGALSPIEHTPEGVRLGAKFQRLSGLATTEGLCVDSRAEGGGQLRLRAAALIRAEQRRELDRTGTVAMRDEETVTFLRPSLTEEYSVSVDGVRQDFVVIERVEGAGDLLVELSLHGAKARQGASGALLTLEGSERELSYDRLHVTDAQGRVLEASLEVNAADLLTVRVRDEGAVYPVRIDPTFSDANWFPMNVGLPGTNGAIFAIVADPSGGIYIGGLFTVAGTVKANNIAHWDGTQWAEVNGGTSGEVRALYFDGTDNLWVGGNFTLAGGQTVRSIAIYNRTSQAWSAPGGHTLSGGSATCHVIAGFNNQVIVGGSFTSAGSTSANNIAAFPSVASGGGTNFSALGNGTDATVRALAVFNSKLHVGGQFLSVGNSIPASYIAFWDGTNWSPIGSGTNGPVSALAVNSGRLYLGGSFSFAGGNPANNIASFDGTFYSALGSGTNAAVEALQPASDGLVYVGGSFSQTGGNNTSGFSAWDHGNSSWAPLTSGPTSTVYAICLTPGGFFVGGSFRERANGSGPLNNLLRYVPDVYNEIGTSMNGRVYAVAINGAEVYVGGNFSQVGGVAARNIAKWNGKTWSALGAGVSGPVRALTFIGSNLFVGGEFTEAGGSASRGFAKWNGTAWTTYPGVLQGFVHAICRFGTDLYLGGTINGGIVRFDGTNFDQLGSGVSGTVLAIATDGVNVYAGGSFASPASNIAKFNSGTWSALGTGADRPVRSLLLNGLDLYAGGDFDFIGGTYSPAVSKWDGNNWLSLDTGFFDTGLGVDAMLFIGSDLYIGGRFTRRNPGNVPANHLLKYDGTTWSDLGSGADNDVNALATDGYGNLYVGGLFNVIGGNVWPFIARAQVDTTNVATAATPMLTSPLANTSLSNAVNVAFDLPQEALADSVKLTFTGPVTRELVLNESEETQGAHSFVFNPLNPTLTGNIKTGTAIPDGAYVVTLSYRNSLGSAPAFVQVLNVTIDNTAPTLTVPDVPVTITTDTNGAVVNYPAATATDNLDANPVVTYSKESGTLFPLGTTTVTVTATDVAGNEAQETFDVVVATPAALRVEQPEGTPIASGATRNYGGSPKTRPNPIAFTIRNPGGTPLTGIYVAIDGPDREMFTLEDPVPRTLDPGESVSFDVVARLTGAGNKTATLRVTSDDPANPLIFVTLTAQVLAPGATAPIAVTLAPTEITATSVRVNGRINPNGFSGVVSGFDIYTGKPPTRFGGNIFLFSSSGSDFIDVDKEFDLLKPHTKYSAVVFAANGSSVGYGAQVNFTTPNRSPSAVDDAFIIAQDIATPLNVLANDTDPDHDEATFEVTKISTPLAPKTAGKVKLAKGVLSFTPSDSFTTATFGYEMTDGFGEKSTASVTLTKGNATIAPDNKTVVSGGETYPITITSPGAWSLVREPVKATWIQFSPASGTGNAMVNVTVLPNATKVPRVAKIRIGDAEHTINQFIATVKPTLGPMNGTPYLTTIGANYTLDIPVQDGPAFDFKATGLPKGLKIDRGTGRISGRPKAAGVFTVTVTAAYYSNAVKTPVDPITFTIDVRAFPGVLSSQYLGLAGRDVAINEGYGSRVEMTISATGVATGKVFTGKKAMPFSVPLVFDDDLTHATLNAPLKNFGTLTAVIDTSDGSATGSIIKNTGETAAVTWWIAASNLADFVGSYSAYLRQDDPNLSLPQNFGFLRFTIEADGKYKVTGQLSDEARFDTAAFVGAAGEVLIYFSDGIESVFGKLTITPGANAPADNSLGGTLDWRRFPDADVSNYGIGFDPTTLTVVGGTYTPPTASQVALGLPKPTGTNPPANATLTFTPSLADTTTPPFSDDIVITSAPKGRSIGTGMVPTNLQKVVTFVDASGAFSGSFLTPDSTRQVDFTGQIVTVGGVTRGYGFFLMPIGSVITQVGANNYSGSLLLEEK